MGGDASTTEIIVTARNLTEKSFADVRKGLQSIHSEAKTASSGFGSSFGGMERSLRQFDDVLELAGGPHMRDLIQGVGQLGDVANGASGSLGGLAKAGLVASAAFGGWSIGRKIAELTGSDAAIGNLTAKLFGLGDVAAQQAAAGADVLARASKNAGRAITDMSEALRINEAVAREHSEAITRANGPAEAAKQIATWREEIGKLRAAGVLGDFTRLVD